jgi:hypothetical protein
MLSECPCTECPYAESRTVYRYAECCFSECRYTECCFSECRYAECRCTECRYAECRGTIGALQFKIESQVSSFIRNR